MRQSLLKAWGDAIAHSNFGSTSLAGLDRLTSEQRTALALRLGPSRIDGQVVNFILEASSALRDEHMPKNYLVRVRFDIETGETVSDIGAPWAPGLAFLASHIWRITSGQNVGPFEAANRLLGCLGAAALREGVE